MPNKEPRSMPSDPITSLQVDDHVKVRQAGGVWESGRIVKQENEIYTARTANGVYFDFDFTDQWVKLPIVIPGGRLAVTAVADRTIKTDNGVLFRIESDGAPPAVGDRLVPVSPKIGLVLDDDIPIHVE